MANIKTKFHSGISVKRTFQIDGARFTHLFVVWSLVFCHLNLIVYNENRKQITVIIWFYSIGYLANDCCQCLFDLWFGMFSIIVSFWYGHFCSLPVQMLLLWCHSYGVYIYEELSVLLSLYIYFCQNVSHQKFKFYSNIGSVSFSRHRLSMKKPFQSKSFAIFVFNNEYISLLNHWSNPEWFTIFKKTLK